MPYFLRFSPGLCLRSLAGRFSLTAVALITCSVVEATECLKAEQEDRKAHNGKRVHRHLRGRSLGSRREYDVPSDNTVLQRMLLTSCKAVTKCAAPCALIAACVVVNFHDTSNVFVRLSSSRDCSAFLYSKSLLRASVGVCEPPRFNVYYIAGV